MELAQRLKNREETAFAEVVDTYGDELKRGCLLMVRDRLLAEEIVQDTFVQAFRKIEQLEDGSKLKSWLTSIAFNKCRSELRKQKWKLFSFDEYEHHFENVHYDDPESSIEAYSRRHTLSRALMGLKQKYREVLILFYYQEYSIEEIVHILDAKTSTIKSRLHRGRQEMQKKLEEGGDFHEFER
ncbi:RNA polymerase sigma factor [Halobacillus salinus]|uniref:RNA polymerase sigma factor n=1 Tax=Halobacillus salinus TaxID=192814 RepID=UPI0009A6868D|nr:RNA polymerase sigma factor [Halobacillus salinus]